MRALPVLAVAAASLAASASAQSLKENEVISSVTVEPLTVIHPALGADNRLHLAYELAFANPGKLFITIDKIEAIDPLFPSQPISTVEGDRLQKMEIIYSGTGNAIAPGGTAAVLMDVTLAADERPPEALAVRITATRHAVGPDGKPAPLPPEIPAPATYTFTAGKTPVGVPARVIDPPLRGPRWMATNGCCDRIVPHRATIMAINGIYRVPERFANDWIQLDSNLRAFEGDPKKVQDWGYYGAPVYSVADGTVVNLYDGLDEQVPGPPKPVSTEAIGGNMIVVDIGGGDYAFYAHLQRGSLKVKLGDRVKAGEVIGLLGNTGNSTAPHLHFHLMDGPSPLFSNGLPYVLRHFTSSGVAQPGDEDALEEGKPARVDGRFAGEHVNQLPLDNEIVDFK